MAKPGAIERDPSTIVPRIKHTHFVKSLEAMNIPADQMPYTEPLVADLLVTYAFDLPNLFQMVSHDALAELAIAPADVRNLAMDNLRRQHPGIKIEEHPPFLQIVTGNNLEACCLLSKGFWDKIASQLPGEVVVAVPSRDVVLIACEPDDAILKFLREVISDIRKAEPTHSLTEQLLTWRAGEWAVYER